ncbi:phosphate uptake regulator PhoU [Candidatus Woesearchaeota archaeon]|nr:phosphate uptake regulator PhoU [Candidatus Woesearchaeota archaeon]
MRRKVVQHGPATLTISLPSKWVKENKIKKGDEVELDVKSKELVILPAEEKDELKKVEIKIPTKEEWMGRAIFMCYVKGYDEIKIKFNDPLIFDKIEKLSEEFIGVEIIDQEENFCILKNIAQELENEFESILRKLFFVILQQAEKSHIHIKEKEYKKLESIRKLGKISNKYSYFCLRIINKKKYNGSMDSNEIYTIIWLLEQISDVYVNICRFLGKEAESDSKIQENIINVYKDIFEIIKDYCNIFYSQKAETFLPKFKSRLRSLWNLSEKIRPIDKINNYVFFNINQILMYIDHASIFLYHR